jgi:cytochrome b pre-mRNA-processing protein 3
MLHMYLIAARVRDLPTAEVAKAWQQQLVDHFFWDMEERMDTVHNLSSRGLRQRYLKEVFIEWRGIMVSYDEGLVKGDAVLAAAVWRNVYKGSSDVDVRHLAAIVSWMRLSLRHLDQIQDEMLFVQAAEVLTRWPVKNELTLVDQPTRELEGVLPRAQPAPVQREAAPIIRKEVA